MRSFLVFFLILFIFYFWLRCVFVAVCGLFSSCGEWALLFVAVRGFLIVVASLCCRAQALGTWALGAWASVVVARRFSSCGTRALECKLSSCGARA